MTRSHFLLLCIWLLIPLVLMTPGTGYADDIPMVGLDSNGKQLFVDVSQDVYEKSLANAVQSVEQSVLSTLNQHAQAKPWVLQSITVGISASVEFGNELILKVSAVPRFRLVFSNSKEPVTP